MLRDHFLAFDETLGTGTSTSYTSDEFVKRLAKCNQMAIFMVGESNGATFHGTIQIEHSGDGSHWVSKYSTPEIDGSLATASRCLWGSDDGASPSLQLVRLRLTVSAAGPAAVKIYVGLRDIASPAN